MIVCRFVTMRLSFSGGNFKVKKTRLLVCIKVKAVRLEPMAVENFIYSHWLELRPTKMQLYEVITEKENYLVFHFIGLMQNR